MSKKGSLVMNFSSQSKPVRPVRRSHKLTRQQTKKLFSDISTERPLTPQFNTPNLQQPKIQFSTSPRKIQEIEDSDLIGLINQNPNLLSVQPRVQLARSRSTNQTTIPLQKNLSDNRFSTKQTALAQAKTRHLYQQHLTQTYKSLQIVKQFRN